MNKNIFKKNPSYRENELVTKLLSSPTFTLYARFVDFRGMKSLVSSDGRYCVTYWSKHSN